MPNTLSSPNLRPHFRSRGAVMPAENNWLVRAKVGFRGFFAPKKRNKFSSPNNWPDPKPAPARWSKELGRKSKRIMVSVLVERGYPLKQAKELISLVSRKDYAFVLGVVSELSIYCREKNLISSFQPVSFARNMPAQALVSEMALKEFSNYGFFSRKGPDSLFNFLQWHKFASDSSPLEGERSVGIARPSLSKPSGKCLNRIRFFCCLMHQRAIDVSKRYGINDAVKNAFSSVAVKIDFIDLID